MPPLLVTAAIIRNHDKILITRRPEGSKYAGFWEFPGGKLETGESPEQGLQREIREELGVDSSVDGVFDVVFHRYDWGDVLLLAYNCRLHDHAINNFGVAEHRWVTAASLSEFTLLPADAPLVCRLQENVTLLS
jgi:8-oxo-dGTP diphosphatase